MHELIINLLEKLDLFTLFFRSLSKRKLMPLPCWNN